MTTYFVSDIHLNEDTKENSSLLLEFLRHVGPTADAMYFLGDLFSLWLGDDLNADYAKPLITALKTLSNQGKPLFIMRGNRDFLLGPKFCQATGCTLLNDPTVIDLYGKKVLITHGDLLCTLDQDYQRFRKVVQHPIIKTLFLSLPAILRLKIATWVKAKSKRSSNYAAPLQAEIWDVSADTVAAWLQKYQVGCIIHGHTHKPAVHELANATRIVLGDWTANSAKILAFNADGFELQDLTD